MSDRPHRSMDDYALLAEEAEHGELRPAPGTAEVSSDYAMRRDWSRATRLLADRPPVAPPGRGAGAAHNRR